MERTLVLVKPDAMQRGLAGQIIERFEKRGLKIVGLKLVHISKDLAGKHYSVHIGKSFYDGLVAYITSCPIIAAVLEGPRAVEVVRKTMGATDSAKAEMGTIRGDFGITIGRNLVHGSDSVENAEKEIKIFFTEKELVTYHRDIDQWIIES